MLAHVLLLAFVAVPRVQPVSLRLRLAATRGKFLPLSPSRGPADHARHPRRARHLLTSTSS